MIAEWSDPVDIADADQRISEALIPSLWSLYGDSDEEVRRHLEHFQQVHEQDLLFIERQHGDDLQVAPLLHQPELPLILDRLETDPRGLLDVWPLSVPRAWLEALAEAWGKPF